MVWLYNVRYQHFFYQVKQFFMTTLEHQHKTENLKSLKNILCYEAKNVFAPN